MNSTKAFFLTLFFVPFFWLSGADTQPENWLGVNLEGVSDYAAAFPFTDIMMSSRAWGLPEQPWVAQVKTDESGWPLEDAGVIVFADKHAGEMAGEYLLSYEGDASVTALFNAAKITPPLRQENGTNVSQLTVKNDANSLMLSFQNTRNGVKNVRLLPLKYQDAGLFHPDFLQALEPFQTIRYMDFLNTNEQNRSTEPPYFESEPLEWRDRTTPQCASQAQKRGVAYEYVIELANTTGKDAWINIPIHASQAYQQEMARMFQENLNQEIKIYVELSNEVWNWQFAAAQYNLHLGQTDDTLPDSYTLCHAERTYRSAMIWKEVFGSAAFQERVRIVLAWQFGWNPPDQQPREMLQYLSQNHGAPGQWLYALAIAPYFSEPLPEDCVDIQSIQEHFIQSSDQSVAGKKLLLNLTREYHLPGGLLCYEGGPHHQGQVESNLSTRIAAHRDSRMKSILIHDLDDNWHKLGGGVFCYFGLSSRDSKWGCWGALDTLCERNTAKYAALQQLAQDCDRRDSQNP